MSEVEPVRPASATGFYPSDAVDCARALDRMAGELRSPDSLPRRPLGGLVPHAGWVYSGPTAARLWLSLARSAEPPEVVVLLGAVHRSGVSGATVYPEGAWWTPLGEVEVAEGLVQALLAGAGGLLEAGTSAHEGEHSLEVQLPLLARWLPGVPIVPIAVPADNRSIALGDHLGEVLASWEPRVAVVASSDLTHYGERYGFAPVGKGQGALDWGRANDRRLLDRAMAFDAGGVLDEARAHRNACGAGALAACIQAVSGVGGRRAGLLEQTTSWEVRPRGEPELFVGYASILYS